MTALHELTIHHLAELLDRGDCSSEEVVQDLFSRIRQVDERMGAYIEVNEDATLEQARSADQARRSGAKGALQGVPLAVKDLLNVKGDPCACGSNILEGYRAPYDATVIRKLREAGAVFLGRVNMDEFAMGSSTENSALKTTRNPWDAARVPGGSSGGSAAAVAADEAIAALGTDTGGSIRQPAAFCGCVGLKPSYGRVSRYGLVAFASSLDQIGPVTKDVRDAAILLRAMSGYDEMDSTSVNQTVSDFEACLKPDLKGMRLGVPREYFVAGMDAEVETRVRAAIDQCADLGADIVEVTLPHTEYAIAVYYIIATAEASANLARFDGVRYGQRVEGSDPVDMYGRTRAAGFGAEVKRRIILGAYVLSSGYYDAYYVRAQKVRTLILQDFEKAFQTCDALLTSTTPTAAFKRGEKTTDPLQMYLNDIYTATVNLAGHCGISVPCGSTSSGLPIGFQIIGNAFEEENILRVAYAYEQATEWHK